MLINNVFKTLSKQSLARMLLHYLLTCCRCYEWHQWCRSHVIHFCKMKMTIISELNHIFQTRPNQLHS